MKKFINESFFVGFTGYLSVMRNGFLQLFTVLYCFLIDSLQLLFDFSKQYFLEFDRLIFKKKENSLKPLPL